MAKIHIVIFVFFALACMAAYASPRAGFPHAKGSLTLIDADYCNKLAILVSDKSNKNELRAAEIISENLSRLSKDSFKPKIFTSEKYLDGQETVLKIAKNTSSPKLSPRLDDVSDAKTFLYKIGQRNIEIIYPQYGDELRAAGIFLENFLGFRFFTPHEAPELPRERKISLRFGTFAIRPSYAAAVLDFPGTDREKTFLKIIGSSDEAAAYIHSPQVFLTPDVYLTRPDFFASQNFKRLSPKDYPQVQPDFMNFDLPWFYAQKADEFFRDNPSRRAFSVVPSDSDIYDDSSRTADRINGYYESLRNYSDVVFEFTNSVAYILSKRHPDRFVFALAYGNHKAVPNFKLYNNIIVYITSDRYANFDEKTKLSDEKLITQWSKSGIGALGLYDYNYGCAYPVPRYAPGLIADGIKNAYSCGAKFYLCEFSPFYAYDAPKMWIIRSLLSDVNADVRKLEDEFFRLYYAESSEPVKEFFAEAEKVWTSRKDKPRWLGYFRRESVCELFGNESIRKMDSAIKKALSLAETNKTKRRIMDLKEAFGLTKLCIKAYRTKREITKNPLETKSDALKFLNDAETLNFLNSAKENAARGKMFSDSGYYFGQAFLGRNSNPIESKAIQLMKNKSLSADSNIVNRLRKILGEEKFKKLSVLVSDAPDFFAKDFANPQSSSEGNLPKGWIRYACTSENAVARIDDNSPTALVFKNILNGGIVKTIPCLPERLYEFSSNITGNFTGGALCYLRMVFTDKKGKVLHAKTLEIPKLEGECFQASIAENSPKESSSVSVGIFFVNLLKGDFAKADKPSLKMFSPGALDSDKENK